MRIHTNIMALNAYRNFGINSQKASKSLQRLSSGYRINSAADDPAGLAISEKMRGQIRGLEMAVQNTHNAVSLLQTAEGGLNEVHSMLTRMKELAVQAANGTYVDETDRQALDLEYQALKDEINRLAGYTNYNGKKLLDGSLGGGKGSSAMAELGVTDVTLTGGGYTGGLKINLDKIASGNVAMVVQTDKEVVITTFSAMADASVALNDGTVIALNGTFDELKTGVITNLTANGTVVSLDNAVSRAADSKGMIIQVGANGTSDSQIAISIDDTSAYTIGIQDTDILSKENAKAAVDLISDAVNKVSMSRAKMGAMQNRLEHTLNNLGTQIENLTAAESRIRDADMAKEMMEYTKYSILMQAAQAMMSQAMNLPKQLVAMLNDL